MLCISSKFPESFLLTVFEAEVSNGFCLSVCCRQNFCPELLFSLDFHIPLRILSSPDIIFYPSHDQTLPAIICKAWTNIVSFSFKQFSQNFYDIVSHLTSVIFYQDSDLTFSARDIAIIQSVVDVKLSRNGTSVVS